MCHARRLWAEWKQISADRSHAISLKSLNLKANEIRYSATSVLIAIFLAASRSSLIHLTFDSCLSRQSGPRGNFKILLSSCSLNYARSSFRRISALLSVHLLEMGEYFLRVRVMVHTRFRGRSLERLKGTSSGTGPARLSELGYCAPLLRLQDSRRDLQTPVSRKFSLFRPEHCVSSNADLLAAYSLNQVIH